jgi:gas vesicle protein
VAQERNEITAPFDARSARDAREPLAQGKADETAEIKSEIERTRVEMSETLGEIQERLRPDHLIQQAKDTVADAATGKVRNIMNSAGETATMMADQTKYAGRGVADYVRMHPVQIALLAGGLTWWLLRNRGMSDDYEGASEGWQDGQGYDAGYSYNEDRPLTAKVGEFASTARESVGEYATTAASTARNAGQRVRSAAGDASLRARQTLQRTTTSVNDWTTEYPLAAGAIAVALGAAVGLSAPATEVENRYMGEKRDQAVERARAAAEELRQNVTQKAKNVAETVVDTANAISSAVTTPASQTSSSSSTGSA